jgi:catechol 2,3-dioxygenase-like lactoylglutathione lyase family enzyme
MNMAQIDFFAHIGITVRDLECSICFYRDNFGFELVRRSQFKEEFFEGNPPLYNLRGVNCDTAILKTPNRVQLELFQFSKTIPSETVPWNRAGLTHFALATDDVPGICKQLSANGISFFMDIRTRPDGGKLMFIRDPDGNLIEVMEPFK